MFAINGPDSIQIVVGNFAFVRLFSGSMVENSNFIRFMDELSNLQSPKCEVYLFARPKSAPRSQHFVKTT